MDTTVMLGHGSGGTMMKRIIDEVFFAAYAGDELLLQGAGDVEPLFVFGGGGVDDRELFDGRSGYPSLCVGRQRRDRKQEGRQDQ